MRWIAAAALLWFSGCRDDSSFTLGRDLDVCEGNYPTACGPTARCVLDESHYLTGAFPSARRFILHTMGETSLQIQIYLTDERAPGTELRLTVSEPSCSDQYVYDSSGQDLFRLASSDGTLPMDFHVSRAGDHLVEMVSDAYCSYTLIWNETQ